MFDVLASPWSCIGAVAGLLIAVLVHWLALSVDAVQVEHGSSASDGLPVSPGS